MNLGVFRRMVLLPVIVLLVLPCTVMAMGNYDSKKSTDMPKFVVDPSKDIVIFPDNVLSVTVYDEPDLSVRLKVTPQGTINYPLLGEIRVTDLTVNELTQLLVKGLGDKYLVNPQVLVTVAEYSSYTMFGEVKSPGTFPLRRNMTIIDALALCGGVTGIADLNKVELIRYEDGQRKVYTISVKDLLRDFGKNQGYNQPILPNDLVIVPEIKY
ncbi:MAG: polysaccharide biosynthesis/export family protein [Elusimicrobiota bacterium]